MGSWSEIKPDGLNYTYAAIAEIAAENAEEKFKCLVMCVCVCASACWWEGLQKVIILLLFIILLFSIISVEWNQGVLHHSPIYLHYIPIKQKKNTFKLILANCILLPVSVMKNFIPLYLNTSSQYTDFPIERKILL